MTPGGMLKAQREGYAELLRATDELYDVMNIPVRSDDGYYDYYQDQIDAALIAYKQAKEKLG